MHDLQRHKFKKLKEKYAYELSESSNDIKKLLGGQEPTDDFMMTVLQNLDFDRQLTELVNNAAQSHIDIDKPPILARAFSVSLIKAALGIINNLTPDAKTNDALRRFLIKTIIWEEYPDEK